MVISNIFQIFSFHLWICVLRYFENFFLQVVDKHKPTNTPTNTHPHPLGGTTSPNITSALYSSCIQTVLCAACGAQRWYASKAELISHFSPEKSSILAVAVQLLPLPLPLRLQAEWGMQFVISNMKCLFRRFCVCACYVCVCAVCVRVCVFGKTRKSNPIHFGLT